MFGIYHGISFPIKNQAVDLKQTNKDNFSPLYL